LVLQSADEFRRKCVPVPAIEGWFTTGEEPHLLGTRCTSCGTPFFPRADGFCRNPSCRGREFTEIALSRYGKVWSYTDAQYQPPPPYIAFRSDSDPDPGSYVPFALAAVHLVEEDIVVLGQLAEGYTVDDIEVGTEVELVVETLYELEGEHHVIYRWKPLASAAS
jgi:hypothetical protein